MPVQGVDISALDGTINWPKVKQAGIEFVYIKATEGLQHDANHESRAAYFQSNWRKTNANGFLRGPYHFFRDNLDSELQADIFVQAIENVGGLNDDDLPPMLDVESKDGADKNTRILRVHRCLAKIQDELGVKPIIYTYRSFWQDNLDATFGEYPLWIAAYGADKPTPPAIPDRPDPDVPDGFDNFVIWQYAEFGKVDGMNSGVDLDFFRGSRDELEQFAADCRV